MPPAPIQPVILTMPGERAAMVEALRQAFSGQPRFREPLIHSDTKREGAARATQQAIRLACHQAPGSPVLLLEDDIQADAQAPQRIGSMAFAPSWAVISFCDMREVEEYAPDGLYRCSALGSDGRGWWGNQALLLHPETAGLLAAADWFSPDIESARGVVVHRVTYDDEGRNCADIRLALIVHCQPVRNWYAVHVPSLFLHQGHQSLCFPGRSMGERSTRNWIGSRRRYGIG
ncbi:MAG: hypothetical protein WCH37_01550 [Synechococcaceae cyanobacterium ELA182]